MADSSPSSEVVPQALYAHRKATEWGLAILAWERGPRRGYQFEDGELRVFRKGYYNLLEEVDTPADKAARIIAELHRKLSDSDRRQASAGDSSAAAPALSLDEQVHAFRIRFPGGFNDPGWISRYRGTEGGRRRRSQVEPAFAEAGERLSPDAIDAALEQDATGSGVHAAAVEVLEHTSLLTPTQLQPLRGLPAGRHVGFARALREVLAGDAGFELRFERFVATLAASRRRAPSWQLATALPALVAPQEHVCVKPTAFREQARWMAPRLAFPKNPNAIAYVRLVDMTRAVKDALEARDLSPRDLMDVREFMVVSLAPSARKLLTH